MTQALILAAGLGTRMRPLTQKQAKPSIELLGLPLIHYAIYPLYLQGIRSFTINTHYLPETVENAVHKFKHCYSSDTTFHFAFEENRLGTGGPHQHLTSQTSFFISNSDLFMLTPQKKTYQNFFNFLETNSSLGAFLCCDHPLAGTEFGALWASQGKFKARGKKAELSIPPSYKPLHFTGLRYFSSEIFKYSPLKGQPQELFEDIIEPAQNEGKEFFCYKEENLIWFELGNPKDLQRAENLLKKLLIGDFKFCDQQFQQNDLSFVKYGESYREFLVELLSFYQITH